MKIGNAFANFWNKRPKELCNQVLICILLSLSKTTGIHIPRECKRSSKNLRSFVLSNWSMYSHFLDSLILIEPLNTQRESYLSIDDIHHILLNRKSLNQEVFYEIVDSVRHLFSNENYLVVKVAVMLDQYKKITIIPIFRPIIKGVTIYKYICAPLEQIKLFEQLNLKLPSISELLKGGSECSHKVFWQTLIE